MNYLFHKNADMVKRITGIAKMKGSPVVNARPKWNFTSIGKFIRNNKTLARILLEVADSPESRRKGLIGRDEIPSICGMLFDGLSGDGFFWMKDCLVPIDVAFFNKNGVITKIYSMSVDKSGDEHYPYDSNDVSAIEACGGFFKKHHITTGMFVDTYKIESVYNG